MKREILTGFLSLAVFLGLATTVKAATIADFFEENDIEVSVSAAVDYYDKYVWRGFLLDNSPVIQPSVTLGVGFGPGTIEGGFWGSFDVEDSQAQAGDEVDGWLGYSMDLGFIDEELEKVGVSFGHTWYGFPEANLYSNEYYLGFSLDVPLAPYVTWYHDYEDEAQGGADGDYVMAGIGHSVTLSEEYGISADFGYEVGYNDAAFINGEGGYHLVSAGFTIPLSDNSTLAPMIAYSSPFGDLEDAADGNQDDEFYGGVSISIDM